MAAYTGEFMTHVTCKLTAKNRDQLRNPTLGNRVWATFYYLILAQLIQAIRMSVLVNIVSTAKTVELIETPSE